MAKSRAQLAQKLMDLARLAESPNLNEAHTAALTVCSILREHGEEKDAVRRVLARGPKTMRDIAKELGVSTSMLHCWRDRFKRELAGSAQPAQSERAEVERLRRDLRALQAEASATHAKQVASEVA